MASAHPLTLFPDLNETPEEVHDTTSSYPPRRTLPHAFNLVVPLNQLLVAKSDIDINSHTLNLVIETTNSVSNLSHRLWSRTNEVQRLPAQLSLFQRMYEDARWGIS
ncbi:hypothetical protein HYC85_028458 [Camellia sinensis]|uniref:Uncharacterized protein n=1 Tax=Camellia sinensis TaxID=4442 RepID=A0A7J7FVZ8_CAMSI|nr:hypothetical protein HYC85_028458 [Camellia sinensis]